MGKLGKITTDVTFGLLSLGMKPLYRQMAKETRELDRRWNESLNQASQDQNIERYKPRTFEVKQPFDAIIHEHHLW